MSEYVKFLLSGLFIAALGEFVNNFIIIIEGVHPLGNFLFAMVFYSVILSFAYHVWRRINVYTFKRTIIYMLCFGLAIGLFLNEWILVGNSLANPETANVMSQFSMISYHTLLYTFPLLVMRKNIETSLFVKEFKRAWLVFSALLVLVLLLIKSNLSQEFVLGFGIILTYFIGYNLFFVTVLYAYVWKQLRKSTS